MSVHLLSADCSVPRLAAVTGEQYITHVVEHDAFKLKSAKSSKSALARSWWAMYSNWRQTRGLSQMLQHTDVDFA